MRGWRFCSGLSYKAITEIPAVGGPRYVLKPCWASSNMPDGSRIARKRSLMMISTAFLATFSSLIGRRSSVRQTGEPDLDTGQTISTSHWSGTIFSRSQAEYSRLSH